MDDGWNGDWGGTKLVGLEGAEQGGGAAGSLAVMEFAGPFGKNLPLLELAPVKLLGQVRGDLLQSRKLIRR